MNAKRALPYLWFSLGYLALLYVFFFLGTLDAAFLLRTPVFSFGMLFCFSFAVLLYLRETAPKSEARFFSPLSPKARAVTLFLFVGLSSLWILYQNVKSGTATALSADVLLFTLLSAAAEECYFRGLGSRFFLGQGNDLAAVLCLSILFGCAHFSRLFLGEPLSCVLLQVVYAMLSGAVFFLVYRKTGHLLYPICLHALHNLITEVGIPLP